MKSLSHHVVVVVAALAFLVGSSQAQDKPKPGTPAKPKPSDTSKPKTTETSKTKPSAKDLGTIEIYKAKDGFRFRIKDNDGKVVAMPPKAFETKDDVEKLLTMLRETLSSVKPTEVKGEK
jgi:uncharacterized protein YegP (UPF0339 family)